MADIPPEGRALLDTISGGESAGAYNVIYGGQTFDDFADHPRVAVRITSGKNKGKTSSAAGKYQFLGYVWDEAKKALGLKDFSPASQDQAAWWKAQQVYKAATKGGDLLTALRSGNAATLAKVGTYLSGTWTSLPGGIEASTNKSRFVALYHKRLGSPSANANLDDQRAEEAALRNPEASPQPGSGGTPAEIYTAPSGNRYRVGQVFNTGKPGSFIYLITKDGIVKTGRNPTGEKTIMGSMSGGGTTKQTTAQALTAPPGVVVKAAGEPSGGSGQTYTINGHTYRVGDIIGTGKPGTSYYTVTPNGLVKGAHVSTGEKTIVGGIIDSEIKKKTGEVVKAAGDSLNQVGSGLAATGANLLEQSGINSVLSGIGNFFGGGGAPAKPATTKPKEKLTPALVVPDVPKTAIPGQQATGVDTKGPGARPGGFGVGSVLVPGATGPTMPHGALAARRAASEAGRLALTQAQEKQAAAARTASWQAAQQKIQAAAAAQARLTLARTAQVNAKTAARVATISLADRTAGTAGLAAYAGQSGVGLTGGDAGANNPAYQRNYQSIEEYRRLVDPTYGLK